MSKIEIFVRHCNFSEVSQHKGRFPGFTRQKCHENLMATLDCKRANVTFLVDTFHPSPVPHFVLQQKEHPIVEVKEGTETGSFLRLLEYVSRLGLSPETIVYFLEDDYLHRPGWIDILEEAFSIPEASYVTLYDHRDKYTLPNYLGLESKIFHTKSCHWRVTPSTTNTYAMRARTLMVHLSIHQQFSLNRRITADHDKFVKLRSLGAALISPMPGWSTHVDPENASPCHDWELSLK
jgi:hypothetical protein